MKRITAILLIMGLLLMTPAWAEETEDYLVVGSMSQISGSFFTSLWGNNTADADVRALLHDMGTVAWTYNGEYAINHTAVNAMTTENLPDGSVECRFTLNEGLKYSDGSDVTAKDFVFTVLLLSSPLLPKLNAVNTTYEALVGSAAYRSGESEVFSGVRLLGEREFSLTIQADALPFYYYLTYLDVQPYPISVLAPGCETKDDGEGAYIDDSALSGGLTEELLRESILGENGYLTHPGVVTGPYRLLSYDEDTHVAEFEKNPYYAGNFDGVKPAIEHITFREVTRDRLVDELWNGDLDLVNKVTDGELIDQCRALADWGISSASYERSGYGFLSFACEKQPTSSVSVRQAVAYCVDSAAFAEQFLGEYGQPVYGYYGLAQPMTKAMSSRLSELDIYGYDPAAAENALIEDGWTLNKKGEAFVKGSNEVRYKRIDGVLTPLTLKWAVSTHSGAAQTLEDMIVAPLRSVGFEVIVERMDYSDLLACYYHQRESDCNLYFLASNFDHVLTPCFTYATAEEYQGYPNTTCLRDEQLESLALDMRCTPSGDVDEYVRKWFAFQQYWVQVLPTVPIYSNLNYDFYTARLTGYQPSDHWSWAAAILFADWSK